MHFEADGQACNDGTDWTGGDDLTHGGLYTTVRDSLSCSVARLRPCVGITPSALPHPPAPVPASGSLGCAAWQSSDQCFQGVCGSWVTIPTVINSEAERLEWVNSDPAVSNQECVECSGQYPMYLALRGGQQTCPADALTVEQGCLGHGLGSVWAGVYSWIMHLKGPDFHFTSWRQPVGADMGDMRGRALFVSKSGACAGVGQWGDQGRGGHGAWDSSGNGGCQAGSTQNQLAVRSEAEFAVNGYSAVEVFVPNNDVKITNVVSHSTRAYTAAPITIGQPFYTDRMYALTLLPDFLRGLQGIKTACDDKHSDPTDLEFLCFDINQRAAVYILYDKRATDRPTWLKSEFTNQHIAVVDDNTDVGLGGLYEIYYKIYVK